MRYKLWLFNNEGHHNLFLEDTVMKAGTKGSFMLRDQSSYAEDNGKLVWKDAAHPVAIHALIAKNKAICIATAMHITTIDPNMNWRVLDYLWKNCQ